jgi:hypothetical protein
MPMTKTVRIGNAQAFWGDRSDAAAEMLAREPDLDYLTLDYLAEVSMSILAMQRERDPAAGFARDFIDLVRSLVPYWSAGGRCRLIANAGGLNPHGCAQACIAALQEAGCRSLRIGVVTGDNVLEMVQAAAAETASPSEFCNLDSGAAIGGVRDRLVTANAYLGVAPIVEALVLGADIVITGRVADPSLVVAPCIHHFAWSDHEFDRLAGATVAGHLIECGTQVTGGISTDWLEVPDAAHIGFPIVEVAQDGSCIVTKPHGSGGRIAELTVKEQLLYEIGDPENYLSPDVAVSFLSLAVDDLGNDRVRVCGARGKSRPDRYKVSATLRDGFRSAGTLTIIGRDAATKARRCGDLVLQRVREAGFELRDSIIECFGNDGNTDGSTSTVMRIAVETESQEAAEYFSRALMPLVTAGPQGTTGYAEGRPRVHPVFRYWPSLIARDRVVPHVAMLDSEDASRHGPERTFVGTGRVVGESPSRSAGVLASGEPPPTENFRSNRGRRLFDIACARSGDKGASANVGVIARSGDWWDFLRTWLTTDRVSQYFSNLEIESVERYELPNLAALNFLLHGALRRNLRTDAQGKAFGQMLLEMPLPEDVARKITMGSG